MPEFKPGRLKEFNFKPQRWLAAVLLLGSVTIVLSRCGENELDVDIAGVETKPVQLYRLENDLFALKADGFNEQTKKIAARYGVFYEHYLMGFLAAKGSSDSLYTSSVLSFINDRDVRMAYTYAMKLYPPERLEKIRADVNDCVKRFKYHFPKRQLPVRLVTCITGWNYAFAYYDSTLVVGLDMYLGDTALPYKMLRYPQYQVRKMSADYILADIARGWMLTEFDRDEAENTLLNHCIFYGKLFYAINALLPNSHDSLIIGYTGKQLKYCETYEKNLWGFFAEKNRLYENNLNTIRELTSDGPFSGVISKECPPRIAMWVGWQIVKSYMKQNKNVTLAELMAEKNAQKLLNKSKYRP